jgi:hypothetical protein
VAVARPTPLKSAANSAYRRPQAMSGRRSEHRSFRSGLRSRHSRHLQPLEIVPRCAPGKNYQHSKGRPGRIGPSMGDAPADRERCAGCCVPCSPHATRAVPSRIANCSPGVICCQSPCRAGNRASSSGFIVPHLRWHKRIYGVWCTAIWGKGATSLRSKPHRMSPIGRGTAAHAPARPCGHSCELHLSSETHFSVASHKS